MSSTSLDTAHAQYLGDRQRGLLATVAPNGAPQNKPVGFRYDATLGTIDIAGFEMEHSAKFRNVGVRPEVAFTVEDVPDPGAGADGVRFVEIRGLADQVQLDQPAVDGTGRWIIRIHPRRIVSWNVAGPGLFNTDLANAAATPGSRADAHERPAVGRTGASADSGRRAVERQIAELQAGLDGRDAETYNRHFADDVAWGSPYGATVEGYDTLHAIHRRLHAAGGHDRSRYEIVRVLTPTPDVTLAQVRRTALDERGEPIPSPAGEPRFSEMALYVLARRDGAWWLAAGQNTIVADDRGAVPQQGHATSEPDAP